VRPPRSPPEPADVLDRHARVPRLVVDHHGARDAHVPEADRVPPLQAHEQVDGRVGARGGQLPDGVCEARVVYLLAYLVGEPRGGGDGGGGGEDMLLFLGLAAGGGGGVGALVASP
jgi:hypothetical protein